MFVGKALISLAGINGEGKTPIVGAAASPLRNN
jgi:hypothetical protein